ncbi:MAG: hypothetical protein OHK0038_19100 [Flammeovirgaceae bacterium]
MKTFEEFKQHFEANVKPAMEELESKRQVMHRKKLELGGIAAVAIILNGVLTFFEALHPYTFIFTSFLAPVAAFLAFKHHFFDPTISQQYKDKVVREMITFIDPLLTYEPEKFIEYNDFADSELFPLKPDIYLGDDKISGTIDGMPLSISEILCQFEPSINKKWWQFGKKKETIFHGIFLIAEYPKRFEGKIFIFPDKLQKKMGYTGMLVQKNNLVRGKYIKPRNEKFRDYFSVYSQNEYEGEKLLTDVLMEKLLELKNITNANIYCALKENKIFVGIDLRKEVFEVNTSKPLSHLYFVKNFYNEVLSVFSIVNILKLEESDLNTILGVSKEGLKNLEIPKWELKILNYILKFGDVIKDLNKKYNQSNKNN